MANWCFNKVLFTGKEEQITALGTLFNKGMCELSGGNTPHEIKRFFSRKTMHGHFRDYTWKNGYFCYETRYVPVITTLCEFADMFKVGFIMYFYEPIQSYYGKFIYEQCELTGISLEENDLDQFEPDKINNCHQFAGQKYDSYEHMIDALLESKLSSNLS